ncbi:MAG: hypothetical protein ACKO0Z_28875 [Betaproteobacteria bacterium]
MKKQDKKHYLQVFFTEGEKLRLAHAAINRGMSMGALIREALRPVIAGKPKVLVKD